ncbi:hypothetical protein BB559_002075 [Furculomyces boomerangus]|uniref:Ubiquitin-like-conjugating enzyme ATG10 n=1 Tax=Furculomyces boomerangus TaxID=61424 RepID=A0A2T9YYC3_9FUNG|nr:hypothetical protein BB559_002075 [Furculomyces boomerangus]
MSLERKRLINFPSITREEYKLGIEIFYKDNKTILDHYSYQNYLENDLSNWQANPVLIIKRKLFADRTDPSLLNFGGYIDQNDFGNEDFDQDLDYSCENKEMIDKCILEVEEDVTLKNKENIVIEYHIVYSNTWKCPVLYFTLYTEEGTTLDFDETTSVLERGYKSNSEDFCKDEIGGVIGIGDHPILQRPFYFVHPCQTLEILKTMTSTAI